MPRTKREREINDGPRLLHMTQAELRREARARDRQAAAVQRRRRRTRQIGLSTVCLSHPVCFPFLFSLLHPLFPSLFSRENSVEIVKLWALSRASLRLVWAQNQPNFRPNRQNAGNFAENPCIPGNYPATAWVFCRFPQFCLRFCPRPALRLRETREFPEWSTKHPLFSLEISGNAKCWKPSRFLFVCRKTWFSSKRTEQPVSITAATGISIGI